MRVFAIADLHLATVTPKPMTVFGPQWAGHPDAIWHEWRRVVRDQDIVLLPGDLASAEAALGTAELDDLLGSVEQQRVELGQQPGQALFEQFV